MKKWVYQFHRIERVFQSIIVENLKVLLQWKLETFSFRPEALEGFDKNPMYKNQYCYGNNLRHITAPKGFSLKYIITYYQAYQDLGKADKFFTRPQWFDLLIGNRTVREQIMKGASEEEIRAGWQNELEAYKKMREKYLLYE